jgi:hypothetical protein
MNMGKRITCCVCGKTRYTGGQYAKRLNYDAVLAPDAFFQFPDCGTIPAGTFICWYHDTRPADPAVEARIRQIYQLPRVPR